MRARRATDAPPVPEASGGVHFPCLDAYRAIGMTMVLANHAAYATGYIQRADSADANLLQQNLAPLIARFDLAVPMFFVLSGFLLYRPFAQGELRGRSGPSLRTFYRRRALRILPGYWAALGGLAVFAAMSTAFDLGIESIGAWLGNLLVLPAVGVPVERCVGDACTVGYGITQAWSIGVEIVFYLLLPLWVPLAHRAVRRWSSAHPARGMFLGCAALWLAGTAFRAVIVVSEPSWTGQTLLWLPMYLDLFAVGMALGVVSAAVTQGAAVPRALRWAGEHPAACWVAALVLLFAVAQMEPPSVPFGLEGREYLPRQLAYGLISAIWLAPSIFGDQRAGLLRRTLASRPLVYLGGISLSFYLWHLAFVEQAKAWTVPDYGQLEGLAVFQGHYLLVAAIAFVATLVVASAVYQAVELPFLRRKRRRRARSVP